MNTKDCIPTVKPRVLLIGHDPRLQNSDTIASTVLFADYYFKKKPSGGSELKKYNLASSTFEQLLYLTNGTIKPEEVYITNLCNEVLPHAPKRKTVYISEDKAKDGLERIKKILTENTEIEFVFPMSLQVNYWLQKLDFYESSEIFLKYSEPCEAGIQNIEPYYKPKVDKSFLRICGQIFHTKNGNQKVIPILHSKNFPLNSRLIAYSPAYENIKKYF